MIATAQSELERGVRFLAKRDPLIQSAVKAYGVPKSRRQAPGFSTLARIVVDQQISTKAAAAIWQRLKTTVDSVNGPALLSTSDADLRSAGLSASKVKTLKALAMAIEEREINFRGLNRKSDEEIKALLTAVWGIGNWTAEIYLMFGMGRPDVWPARDLALRTGWQDITTAEIRLAAEDLALVAEQWRPHRSAAAILLWHAVAASRKPAQP